MFFSRTLQRYYFSITIKYKNLTFNKREELVLLLFLFI